MGSGDGAWPDETDPGMHDIDPSIAEPELLGQGLGTLLVKALVVRLFADPADYMLQRRPGRGVSPPPPR